MLCNRVDDEAQQLSQHTIAIERRTQMSHYHVRSNDRTTVVSMLWLCSAIAVGLADHKRCRRRHINGTFDAIVSPHMRWLSRWHSGLSIRCGGTISHVNGINETKSICVRANDFILNEPQWLSSAGTSMRLSLPKRNRTEKSICGLRFMPPNPNSRTSCGAMSSKVVDYTKMNWPK